MEIGLRVATEGRRGFSLYFHPTDEEDHECVHLGRMCMCVLGCVSALVCVGGYEVAADWRSGGRD